jgi:predicted acetyltransferase
VPGDSNQHLETVEIERAGYERKSTLRNLVELYLYDLSVFEEEESDVNECGLYEYEYLDHYWTEPGREAFLIRVNGKLAGFALVLTTPEHHSMEEFFVMRRYRGRRIGQRAAHQLFDLLPGRWRIAEMRLDTPAQNFWRKVISRYHQVRFVEGIDPTWAGPVQEFSTRD